MEEGGFLMHVFTMQRRGGEVVAPCVIGRAPWFDRPLPPGAGPFFISGWTLGFALTRTSLARCKPPVVKR